MTEKKPMKPMREQKAFHSYRPIEPNDPRSSDQRSSSFDRKYRIEQREIPHRSESNQGESGRQRVVKVPDPRSESETISGGWEEYARRRGQRHRNIELAPASFSQVARASSSHLKPQRRRTRPLYAGSPIPRRSGYLQRRRSLWRRFLGLFALVLLIILGVNFVFTGAAFRVDHVNIVGTNNTVLVQAIQHMGIQGQNIFLLNVAALTTRIGLFPLVASTNLEKQWPNQLSVTVIERTPVLLWQTQQGTYSVDNTGAVIAPVSETIGTDHLMTVVDTTVRQKTGPVMLLQPGSHLHEADIAFALAVFATLPQVTSVATFTLQYEQIVPMAHTNSGESGVYTITSPDGWLAYLGGADNSNPLENRLRELQQILTLTQQQQLHLATIDLRFGLRPVYTLKN